MKTWKIAGINFGHGHMGDLLRHVHEHPHAEIVGVSDEQPARMQPTAEKLGTPRSGCSATTARAWSRPGPTWSSSAPPRRPTPNGPSASRPSARTFSRRNPSPRRWPRRTA